MKVVTIIVICSFAAVTSLAQQVLTLHEMIGLALQNNAQIHASALDIDYEKQNKRLATDIGKTNIVYTYGQVNGYVRNDYNLTLTQSLPFPTVFFAQNALSESLIKRAELQKQVDQNELIYRVKQAFFDLLYLKAKVSLLHEEDSIYADFMRAADQRYKTGSAKLLEKATADAEWNEVKNQLAMTEVDIITRRRLLQTLLNTDDDIFTNENEMQERPLTLGTHDLPDNNPGLAVRKQQIEIAAREKRAARAHLMPDLTFGYFSQTFIGAPLDESGIKATRADRFHGIQVGLSVPLWLRPQVAKVKASEIIRQRNEVLFEYDQDLLEGEWEQCAQTYLRNKNSLEYYESALKDAEVILHESTTSYHKSEIDYQEYWLSILHSIRIRDSYLQALSDVNHAVIRLEYLAGMQE